MCEKSHGVQGLISPADFLFYRVSGSVSRRGEAACCLGLFLVSERQVVVRSDHETGPETHGASMGITLM